MRWTTAPVALLCALVVVGTATGALLLARSLSDAAAAGTGTLAGLQATGGPTAGPPDRTAASAPTATTVPPNSSAAGSAAESAPDGIEAATQQPAAAPVVTVPALTPPAASTALTVAPTPPADPAPAGESAPAADPAPAGESAPAADPAPAGEPAPQPAPADPGPATAPEPGPADPGPGTPAAAPEQVQVVPPYSTVLGWHGDQRVAYLTFDDGPAPGTGRILDILAGAGVKATFCMIGQRVAENPDTVRRVVADGHTVCNHSWDHPSPFDSLPAAGLQEQIGRTQDAISQATGVTARYFRAPEGRFGDTGGAVLQSCQRAGTIPLGWGVDSLDWKLPGVPAIVAGVLGAVSPGAVILLHDGGGADREQTIAALPGIIAGLQAAGYTLAALPPDPVG